MTQFILQFIMKGIIVNWLKSRLIEPSTHAALAVAIVALLPIVPDQWHNIAQGVAVALGGAGVLLKEKS